MPKSPDPDEWSLDDWREREFVDYRLEPHERQSLDAIRKNLETNAYKDPSVCFDHMEFLEDLANKLRKIVENEQSLGKANWDVERAYKESLKLYERLRRVRDSLSGGMV